MLNEVNAGIEFLRRLLGPRQGMKLGEYIPVRGRRAYRLVFTSGIKQSDIVLSEEFLSDLPATTEYQATAYNYLVSLAQRMENFNPSDFFCKSQLPLRLKIEWPLERVQKRAAIVAQVHVSDLTASGRFAACSVFITDQQYIFDLKRDPFRLVQVITDTVRDAMDRGEVAFDPSHSEVAAAWELRLRTGPATRTTPTDLQEFLVGKVYWLGFKRGDKSTKVWIADPWDAAYLGVEPRTLIQTSQILQASSKIVLGDTQEYAHVGDALLREADRLEAVACKQNEVTVEDAEPKSDEVEWDAFICHASEDKDNFVRPLAEVLRRKELRVWYDDFTLKVGDSLRRSIDHGLKHSRYGVVVLSPAFFAKEWPQRELDGLVAKEVGGKKVILPVWLNVTAEDVRNYSLILADRVAASSSEGLEAVVQKLVEAISE